MENEQSNTKGKNPSIDIRQKIIRDIIKNNENITSIGKIITRLKVELNKRYPNKYPDAEFSQPLISKDLKDLGIKSKGREKGFAFTEKAIMEYNTNEIKSIFDFAQITENDIVRSMFPLIIKVQGYSQAISLVLKKIYGNAIVETICLESSLVIFCDSEPNRKIIGNSLIKIINNEFDYDTI